MLGFLLKYSRNIFFQIVSDFLTLLLKFGKKTARNEPKLYIQWLCAVV